MRLSDLLILVKNSSWPTDHLTVNGPVTGTTTIYVNNLNTSGVGAYTGQGNSDGISLVSSSSNLASNAFQLGVNTLSGLREVISGAFSYQRRCQLGDRPAWSPAPGHGV